MPIVCYSILLLFSYDMVGVIREYKLLDL